jgi:hypothetical protein
VNDLTDGWLPPKPIDSLFKFEQSQPRPQPSPEKLQELAACEVIIENGWQTVLEVGLALAQIRDGGLYFLDSYESFENYCRDKWSYSKTHANRMIGAGKVAKILTPIGAKCQFKESQLRPLTALVVSDQDDKLIDEQLQAEKVKAAWKKAETLAKTGQVTAKHVKQAVVEFLPPDDGKRKKRQTNKSKAKTHGLDLFDLLDEADAAAKDADMPAVIKILAKLRNGLAEH